MPQHRRNPDGAQVWFTLKDSGKVQLFDARPPFAWLRTLDTGPISNHVNFVRNLRGQFAYVTAGGLDEIQVFRTDGFTKVATIPVGKLPHRIGLRATVRASMWASKTTTNSSQSTR